MSTKNSIEIDGNALQAEVSKVGVTLAYASEALGYSKNYLSNVINKGVITKQMAVSIDSMFKIPLETYQLKQVTSTERIQEQTPKLYGIDYGLLAKVIRQSVYDAMTEALKG